MGRPCIEGWLVKHCTCPVCRFELETDDPSYERGRVERMRTRKPRFRQHELERLTVRQLRDLISFLKIDSVSNFLEKRELVDKVLKSGKIELIASPPPLEYKQSDLRALSVGKLKKTMNEAGVFFDPIDVVEKEDMVKLFINSGRVMLMPEDELQSEKSEEELIDAENEFEFKNYDMESVTKKAKSDVSSIHSDNEMMIEENNSTSLLVEASVSQHSTSSTYNTSSQLKSYLMSKSITQLKALGRERGVSLVNCVEKNDMVDILSLSYM